MESRYACSASYFFRNSTRASTPLLGHGIIDGRPQAAHALVALQVVEAGGLGGGHHIGILLLAGGDEGHVHQGTVLLADSTGEELALVQEIVQHRGLFSSLRLFMASSPPFASRYLKTLPQQ